jgi:GT2 family glycosyltransferase
MEKTGLDRRLQTYVIDNASSDDIGSMLAADYPWVHFISSQRNLGFGAGNNLVLPFLVRKPTDYHLVLNPDIEFVDDPLEELTGYMDAHPDVVMSCPRVCFPDGSEQLLPKRRPQLKYLLARRLEARGSNAGWVRRLTTEYTMADARLDGPVPVETCSGSFFVIRTAAFLELGGFDERYFMYFEDNDLSMRAARLGRLVFNPAARVIHHYERAALRDRRMFAIQMRSMLRFILTYGP